MHILLAGESAVSLGKENDAEVGRDRAEPLFQRSLTILKAKFPGGHPKIDLYQKNYDELKHKMAEQGK